MPAAGYCTLMLFDIRGSLMAVLMDGEISAGLHEYSVSSLSPGAYFVRLDYSGEITASSLVVLE